MGNLIFYGPVKFTNNTGNSYLLNFNFTAGSFTCYNYIGILHNDVKRFLYAFYRTSIIMKENTNLEIKYNIFSDYFANFQEMGKPYPKCFFQYFSKKNYDQIWYHGKKLNYSVSFIDNYMKPFPYSYIAECDWYIDSAFKEVIPLEVNTVWRVIYARILISRLIQFAPLKFVLNYVTHYFVARVIFVVQ